MSELIDVALAKEKADLIVANGTLVNVYTGELLEETGVAVKGEYVAYVGPNWEGMVGADTVVIDAGGRFLVPGFIDAHAHVDNLYMVSEFVKYAVPGGTTTVITETSAVANAMGYAGVVAFVEVLKAQPIPMYALAPAMVPAYPDFESSSNLSNEEIEGILELPDVVGLGETYWPRVIQSDEDVLRRVAFARQLHKPVQGHSAGARSNKLAAYAAAGILSCHEPITADEAMERLRLGMHVMVRDGSMRRDLEAISSIKDRNIDLRRVVLVTDGLWPDDLLELGCVDFLVRKAIGLGFDPMKAIQMATINPAEHFHLDHLVGGIAPGKYANLLLVPDLREVKCDCVISKGRVVAEHGRMTVPVQADAYPEALLRTMHLPCKLVAGDFAVEAPDGPSKAQVRVMDIVGEMLVAEHHTMLPVVDGHLQADPTADIIKVATLNRYDGLGTRFVAFLRGFGLRSGAMASSVCWDTYNIVVAGAGDDDMAVATNRLAELQGGVVLCEEGRILEEIPLPIGGIISTLPTVDVRDRLLHIDQELVRLGCTLSNPFLTLQTLTFTGVPHLRLTERGLLDVRHRKLVGVVV
ncbi:MAG: adenine deaminase [Chloroflexi bacterium]|nr:adenine deaminase [Chloroflexota bacterium]